MLHYSIFRIILSDNRWIYLFAAAHSRVRTRKTFVADPLIQTHICFLWWTILGITTSITLSDWTYNIRTEGGLVRNINFEDFLVWIICNLVDLLNFLLKSLSFFLFSKLFHESLFQFTSCVFFVVKKCLRVIGNLSWILSIYQLLKLAFRSLIGSTEYNFSFLSRFFGTNITADLINYFFNLISLVMFELATDVLDLIYSLLVLLVVVI